MAQQSTVASPPKRFRVGRIAWWFLVLISAALLVFLIVSEVIRFSTPISLHRLQIVQDIPLPDALPDSHRTSQNPFASGEAQRFDHFDFQSLDPATHLLFIAHTGPNPDKQAVISHNPHFDAGTDGNVVVFNTQLNKVVGLINVPQGAGILVAPDIGKVFIGDSHDGIIYIANEHSPFNILAKVQLDPLDSPDAIEYDSVDHKIFVGDPGVSDNPDDANIALKNQNVALIDQNSNAVQTPPSFLAVIDPVALQVVSRIRLPDTCLAPHGLVIDVQQREAFVACVASQNLVRVDLRTMRPFPGDPLPVAFNPDIVRLDHPFRSRLRNLNNCIVASSPCKHVIQEFDKHYALPGSSNRQAAISPSICICQGYRGPISNQQGGNGCQRP